MFKTTFAPFHTVFIEHKVAATQYSMPDQHYHDVYEFYLQLSEKRYFFCNGTWYTLQAGDFVLIKPFDLHHTQSHDSDYTERYVLNFSSELLYPLLTQQELQLLFSKFNTCIIHLTPCQQQEVFHHFKTIDAFSKQEGFLHHKLLVTALFQFVMLISNLTQSATRVQSTHLPPEILVAIQYIEEHYREPLSLTHIADIVHMSKYHFCRLFHQTTGISFLDYLRNVRLAQSHQLLLTTSLSVGQIAFQTGFSSSAHLSRVFKQIYQISPREFKKLSRS